MKQAVWPLALLTAAWSGAYFLPIGSAFVRLGIVALCIAAYGWIVDPRGMSAVLTWRKDAWGLGALAGAVAALLTHVGWAALAHLWPALGGEAGRIYTLASFQVPLIELPLLLLVVFAEEVLWRGLWPRALSARMGASTAWALSIGLYVLGQAGSVQPLVMLAAALLGTVWSALAWWKGLWAALASHIVWLVILLVWRL